MHSPSAVLAPAIIAAPATPPALPPSRRRRRPARGVAPSGVWQPLLQALLDFAGGAVELRLHQESEWASGLFTGTRHRVVLDLFGSDAPDRADHLLADLSEHTFAIPGQLVADATVTELEEAFCPQRRLTLTCELLLVDLP